MTKRFLRELLEPESVALVGASDKPATVGAVLARNLLSGGFRGPLMLVNPHMRELDGHPVSPDVASLPDVPQLAVIATPPATVPDLIAQLGARGCKAAIVITAGFGETGEDGRRLQQAMLDAAKPNLLRILGPNCFGTVIPHLGLNTSFGRVMPQAGRIALVSQSGAINATISDWAAARNIGFSHLVSLGGMADVDFGDMLDHLANDERAEAILLYVEAITEARKFMSAARAAASHKPVIVVKAGRTAGGAAAAASHTGALTGADDVYDAAFRRAGMLRVDRLEHLFEAVETIGRLPRPRGARLAIISNGGGLAVMAADAVAAEGVELARLGTETVAHLNSVLPPTWSKQNPVDIIGDAAQTRYLAAMEAVFTDRGVDTLLVIHCPTAIQSSTSIAEAVAARIHAGVPMPVFASWAGCASVQEGRSRLSAAGIANFETPEEAVRGFAQIATFWRNQKQRLQAPPAAPRHLAPDLAAARALIGAALAEGRSWLDPLQAMALMKAYDIAVARFATCSDPGSAAVAAADIGGQVALKVISPDVLHKSDVGGVVLGLTGERQVRDAAIAMMARISHLRPAARIDGFLVQAMIDRPKAHSLLAGMACDPTFGPVILFGHGGTAVEVIADRAIGLPPLNMSLARDLNERTRVSRLLKGYRDVPPADSEAIAFTLVKLSQLIIDNPEIVELDLNPLLADDRGIVAVDARVRVEKARLPGDARLAIKPYPRDYEESIRLNDADAVDLRPVMPEDADALAALADRMVAGGSREAAATAGAVTRLRQPRFAQIDYDRQMTFLALDPSGRVRGVTGVDATPDNEQGHVTLAVDQEGGTELASLLLGRVVSHARQRGIGMLTAEAEKPSSVFAALWRKAGGSIGESHQTGDGVSLLLPLRPSGAVSSPA